MTDPMSDERLAEIRERAQAATKGPWECYPSMGADFVGYVGGDYLRGVGDLSFGEGEQAQADKAFTLAAREDVPALLAEVERLRAEMEETRDTIADPATGYITRLAKTEAERDAARAEVEQWRATFGESALRDGLARMARVEAERDAARLGMEKLREALVAADKLAAGLRAELAEEKRDFDRLSKLYVSACQGASERAELRAERDRLAKQVQRVRALHWKQCIGACGLDDNCECEERDLHCGECNERWPCGTIRALDGTGDGS